MDYNVLRMERASGNFDKNNIEQMTNTYVSVLSEFVAGNLSVMTDCIFNLKGKIGSLPNIMHSRNAPSELLYVLAFFLFDLTEEYYTDRADLDAYEIRFTLEGSGTLEYKGKRYNLKKGEGFFISNKERHIYYAGSRGWKSTVLHIGGSLVQHYYNEFESAGGPIFSSEDIPTFEMLQMQALTATQKVTPYMDYRISCYLNLLLTELLSLRHRAEKTNGSLDQAFVGQVCEYLRDNLDHPINFDTIAKNAGVSRSVFYKQFRIHTGFTPGDYLLQLRINKAKLLLKATDMSIEEIATATGYNDAGHFSQVFKKYEGITPLRYRK